LPRDELLTLPQVTEELGISASTFYDWRSKNRAPKSIKLPNGSLRVRRSSLNRWLEEREGI
jgi:predicted DNA-binding transcriptional regulator AlpA